MTTKTPQRPFRLSNITLRGTGLSGGSAGATIGWLAANSSRHSNHQLQTLEECSVMVDAEEFRKGIRAFTTGVTVITMPDGKGGMHAMTASSFAAVSIDPRLVAVSVAKSAKSHSLLTAERCYAINILGETQGFHAQYFANRIPHHWEPPHEWVGETRS